MFSSLLRRKPTPSSPSPNPVSNPSGPVELSDLQLVILSRAAQHPEGQADIDAHADAEGAMQAIETLVERGLLAAIPEADDHRGGGIAEVKPLCSWRITAAGLVAISVAPSQMPEAYRQLVPVTAKRSELKLHAHQEDMVADSPPQENLPLPRPKLTKRTGAGTGRKAAPSGRSASSEACPAAPLQSGQFSEPGREKNCSRLVGLLSRNEGATIPEIIEATGWLAHSSRAALSGLRKQGLIIQREQQSGDRGTVYRIVAEAAPTNAVEGC